MPTRHNHGPAAQGLARSDQRRLLIVLGVTSAYFITELAGGYLTGSLALLSDAVHLLTDIAALCLALLTLWISTRPASSAKTYGYLRAEILGALLNGLFLWLLVVFIWIEAARRLRHPQEVKGLGVMAVAIVGGPFTMSFLVLETTGDFGLTAATLTASIIASVPALAGRPGYSRAPTIPSHRPASMSSTAVSR